MIDEKFNTFVDSFSSCGSLTSPLYLWYFLDFGRACLGMATVISHCSIDSCDWQLSGRSLLRLISSTPPPLSLCWISIRILGLKSNIPNHAFLFFSLEYWGANPGCHTNELHPWPFVSIKTVIFETRSLSKLFILIVSLGFFCLSFLSIQDYRPVQLGLAPFLPSFGFFYLLPISLFSFSCLYLILLYVDFNFKFYLNISFFAFWK